jgi:hypothetical protein
VSSTVVDLGDLRSSIKYLLEESGFQVALSEVPGFEHPLHETAPEAAIDAIEGSDYYVLLVGDRYGRRLPDGLSVTRAEFRRARDLAAAGRLRLILFARGSVLDLWRNNVKSVRGNPDWRAVGEFLQEIHEEQPGVSNWVHRFDSFRDVADTLRAVLRLSGPLRRRALEANLLWELRANVKACHYARVGHRAIAIPNMLTSDAVPEPGENDHRESYHITNDQANKLAWFRMLTPGGARGLRRRALHDAIGSGDFLEFDKSDVAFRVGRLQGLLLDLDARIEQFDLVAGSRGDDPPFIDDMERVSGAAKAGATGGVTVRWTTLRICFVLRNQLWNILAQSVALARMLAGLDPDLLQAVVVPVIPPPLEESPENDREMSDAEVDEVLSSVQMQ